MTGAQPLVSVVLPSRGRPQLVLRAAKSALSQTLRDIEVIVALDGADEETQRRLDWLGDTRLRVVTVAPPRGASSARNRGVDEAQAPWVALLDDDDEWRPEKLRLQHQRAAASDNAQTIVSCRLTVETPRASFVLPRRLPEPAERISEYLTVRHGPFHGEGFIQTSTIYAPATLLRRVRFDPGLRRLQEMDWVLRAIARESAHLEILPDALVVWHADEDRARLSFDLAWHETFDWMRTNRDLFTRRAYAAGVMSIVSSMAAPSHDPRAFIALVRDAARHGDPAMIDYVTFLQVWALPQGLRRYVRERVLSRAIKPA